MKPLLLGGVWKCQKWVENANQTQLKPKIWYTSWKLPKKWGNRPKKEETYQQTENLKLFLKTGNGPKKRGNGPKKRGNRLKKWGNRSTNWEFTTFFENRKRTQKMRKRTQKKRKPINKLRIWNFFWKPETDPKNEETDPKKEETDPNKGETDQQTESLKLFLKTGNWPKKKRKRTQKNGKRIKCKYSGNRPKISGNPSTLFSFWGISDNSWKKKETDPISLLGPFPCWGVSIAPFQNLRSD